MQPEELMTVAIAEAERCNPRDPKQTPKVGAVISIDGRILAANHRGDEDHAEKRALEAIPRDQDLSRAIVYTTLEPCTPHVRRKAGESCTERLIRAKVAKVVIGILDPNQGVCGKGVLALQDANIEIGLFPHDLAQRIRRLNDEFIQAQQSLGIVITSHMTGDEVRGHRCVLRGTFVNPPGDNVYAITHIEGRWWPQRPLLVNLSTREWEVQIDFGIEKPHDVWIVKASELGMHLLRYYHDAFGRRIRAIQDIAEYDRAAINQLGAHLIGAEDWAIPFHRLPKGLDSEAGITLNPRFDRLELPNSD